MLKKQYVKSRQVAKVTFELPMIELPDDVMAESVSLVGEFNEWDPTVSPMTYSKKNKSYRATLELEPGRAYQFRYFVNGERWCNDWQADAYIPGHFGEDNCVVVAPSAPKSILKTV